VWVRSAGVSSLTWLDRFRHRRVVLPALVLEHELLDGDVRAVGVERRQRLIERRPAAIDLVGEHALAGLVVAFEIHIPAKVGEGDLAAERGDAPGLVRPVFERAVLSQAALELDRVIFRAAWRFA
jgi:hypothetical protein